MKKLIIPATVLLIAASALTLVHGNKSNIAQQVSITAQTYTSDNTRSFSSDSSNGSFTPQFAALNVPDNMKQNFRINPKRFQILVGKCGTILSIPENSFRTKKGNAIDGKVKLELIEGIKTADILKMNLGTMSDQGPLETGGMISVNVFSESGDTLVLADDKKIDVEIPTDNKKDGMKLWDGIVHDDGSVSWKNPQPLNDGLHAIPPAVLVADSPKKKGIDDLKKTDAVPNILQVNRMVDVSGNLVAFNYINSKNTIYGWLDKKDGQWHRITSNVYSNEKTLRPIVSAFGQKVLEEQTAFGWWNEDSLMWVKLTYDEPVENKKAAVKKDGTNNALVVQQYNQLFTLSLHLEDHDFSNTNIATAEFRSRIPYINEACDPNIMLCYTNNPKRDLWKSDLEAADILDKEGCPLADLFRQFGNLKQGKVNPQDPKTTEALNEAREKAVKNYSDNVHKQQRLMDSLCPMFSYSFGMQRLGWANVDRCASQNSVLRFFNLHVNGEVSDNDNLEVKMIIPQLGIFLPGYKRPNGDYSFTHGEQEQTAMYPDGEEIYLLAKVGSGDRMRFDLKKIIMGENGIETLSLHWGTEQEFNTLMGNTPEQKKNESEKIIDDWYTKAILSGGGCVCGGAANK